MQPGSRKVAFALCLAAVGACGGSGPDAAADDAAALRTHRQELLLQHASLQNQLRLIQGQALDSPQVRAAQAAFRDALTRRMVEIDPRAASWLERAKQVGHDLAAATGEVPVAHQEKVRVAAELRTVEKLLAPVQDSAFRDPTVAARFSELQDSLVAVIVRIDPAARALIDRSRELESEMLDIDRRIGPPGTIDSAGSGAPAPEASGAEGGAPDG
ncbi:MAG: hypothetical protein ACE5HF_09745 [Gemmatimonadota bacterium]